MSIALATICAVLLAPDAHVGDKVPKGAPWFTTYREAKRDALRHGRPVFVYFTKTY